ncbi:MAG: protein translocase subunit SecD [bacterium]
MERKLWPRVVLLVFFILMSVAYLVPSVVNKESLPTWYTRTFNKQILKGLDLAGGVYLEYHVELDEAIEDNMERIGGDIRAFMLEKLRKTFKRGKDDTMEDVLRVEVDGSELTITLLDNARSSIGLAKTGATNGGYMDKRNPVVTLVSSSVSSGRALFRMDPDHSKKIEESALSQARETIEGRVDEFGVAGADVRRREDSIIVELPGLSPDYIKRVKTRLGAAARLEFKIVDDGAEQFEKIASLMVSLKEQKRHTQLGAEVLGVFMENPSGKTWKFRPEYRDLDKVKAQVGDEVTRDGRRRYDIYLQFPATVKETVENFFRKVQETPALAAYRIASDRQIGYGPREFSGKQAKLKSKAKVLRTYYLHKVAGVTGEYLDDARADYDQDGKAIVAFRFGREGERKFRALTRKNIKRKMAIILDREVKSAPVIQSEIGARGQITLGGMKSGQELQQEAKDLASILKAGSLPAPMSLEFEQQVGPKLGADAIQKGTTALIIGSVLVILFMLVYYRLSGVIAVVALVLNMLFILAILAAAEARLTLPGIAGIVLTVGMAVDANVIIFERIREELRLGKTPRAAIDAGYSRAFWTIIDAQVTTAIAGFVLWQYGSGPIKGFAVTLLIGIVCSVYTGVFASRVIFDFLTKRTKMEQLSI